MDKWQEIIEKERTTDGLVMNVNHWLGKATLDACVKIDVVWIMAYKSRKGSELVHSNTTSVR